MSKLLFAFALLASCQTTPPSEGPTSSLETPSIAAATEDISLAPEITPDGAPAEVDEANFDPLPLVPEEENFCRDDIYAQYLIEEFEKSNEKPKGKVTPRDQRRRELQALNFARGRMLGESVERLAALPVVANDRVESWRRYFKAEGRRDFLRWLVRGEALGDTIIPILQEQGMPIELFYLAMVESGFSSHAASAARATGPWQFMKGTALLYGLRVDHWVDERRDPIKSTVAAARYFRDLYTQFGDWYLAMAAYNAGPGKIRRAIRAAKTKDYWKLIETPYLSKETKEYVPKVLGALLLAQNSKAAGFDARFVEHLSLPKSYIELDSPTLLAEIATALRVPVRDIRKWNPEISREVTPPNRGSMYQLRMPENLVQQFNESKPALSVIEIDDVQMHKVVQGDTLHKIARLYKVPVKQILTANPDLSPKALRVGRSIAVPIPGVNMRKVSGERKKDAA
jgi:membrane-bound lytic murein transglycosylase D